MISNLLVVVFTALSHNFAIPLNITDQNNHHKFDLNQVDCIGKIRIDDSFMEHVLNTKGLYIVTGKELQKILLRYIKEKCYIFKISREYQRVKNLIHGKTIHQEEIINLQSLICELSPKLHVKYFIK